MTTEILTDLKGENNNAFGILYKEYFGMVLRFVKNNSGRADDAEDIFQDAMVVLIQKLRQDEFELTASLKTYVMAISKNLWLKRLRTAYRETELTAIYDDQFYEEIDLAIEQEKSYKDQLQTLLHKITAHCQGLIHDMFFKEKTIDDIQRDYGYSSIHNAQNQKHKCIEQIRREKERQEMSGRK
ncbi:hypothetical protein BH10BAC6_BH10BAC6_17060 [soil metagenome]